PGDLLVVTGACGGSLLGRHLAVVPRCREATLIADRFEVHAAIDVSDGLSLDLSRMMRASGTGAILWLDSVPIHADAERMSRLEHSSRTPLDHALGDGEDFELVLALPPRAARALESESARGFATPVTVIGEVTADAGLVAEDAAGARRPLEPRGFVHDFDS
ncbi:MAG: thiamine-phosphate kinase, partial [Planctomycetia bacterium]